MKVFIFTSAILFWGLNLSATESVKYLRMSQSAEIIIDITSTDLEQKAAEDEAYNRAMKAVSVRCDPYWGDSGLFDVATMTHEKNIQKETSYLITASVSGLCKKHPPRETK